MCSITLSAPQTQGWCYIAVRLYLLCVFDLFLFSLTQCSGLQLSESACSKLGLLPAAEVHTLAAGGEGPAAPQTVTTGAAQGVGASS